MHSSHLLLSFLTLFLISSITDAFLSPSLVANRSASIPKNTKLYEGRLEQIEFKIFPDGRIEESVRGIKGGECHKVTEEINQSLGKVVASRPTEEMYEQEIVIEQTLEVQNGADSSSSSGWDGSSSW
mmetsp:Transcript_2218/g.2996  ORF Transcript_2218/g.2996 Transcript_2218/m.2996 type:complete len:127 (+) Transcript_2218:103-483(+)